MDPRPISKVVVANRGEIARRVFAACRRMGIGTVAVHSHPDAEAPFVREADEAVALGGVTAAESYLRGEAVIAAARATGAEAIHPGYGFLAENADFARAVLDAGLVWIGPGPEAIEAMGSKVRARALMQRAGVPVLPGIELDGVAELGAAAEEIGFPLLVKASAGGGGKGMRSVAEPAGLAAAVDAARREAESAFGDGTLFLERLLERPRHVEIQVFADRHGNTVSLGERECSIQRRHQKVIEEAPSPAVDHELRRRMGEAAVAAAEAVGYLGAGTVEFLLGPAEEFFFLEMNTRLQVEHPVTEMVTGIDLVRLQLLVAAGESLPADLHDIEPRGHAIEARLYAEDPANDYLPQTGRLDGFDFADPGSGGIAEFGGGLDGEAPPALRIDSGFGPGDVVSPHYDPMLAKLVAWAPTRPEAVQRLASALARGEVSGPVNNRDFLVRVLREPEFLAGATDTGFLERHDGLGAPLLDSDGERLHAAAAALAAIPPADERPLGFAPVGWRNNPAEPQRRSFGGRDGELTVDYAFHRDGLRIAVDSEPLAEPMLHSDPGQDEVDLEVAGVRRRFRVRRGPTDPISGTAVSHVSSPLGHASLRELPRYPADEEAAKEGALVAPMPGKVLKLVAAEGEEVEAGEVVAVLEAMKMEHELTAPAGGTVAELRVSEGEQVESGAVLGIIDPPD